MDALLLPPPPQAMRQKAELFSVSVHNVPIRDLLFAIARDARLNLDVHPDLQGTVSINAIDQTIQSLLDRAAVQVDMRYEMQGRNLFVMPDAPILRHYQVDYPNVTREAKSTVSASSSIGGAGASGNAGNSSSSALANTSNNRFWETLTQNIKDLLRETDKLLPEGNDASASATRPLVAVQTPTGTATGSAPAAPVPVHPQTSRFREAASVIANPETGVISVRATYRQHLRVREFMDRIISGARRQVMIEATIVEVNLSDQYQQGINWTVFRQGLPLLQFGPAGTAQAIPGGTPVSGIIPSMMAITPSYSRPMGLTQISAALRLLESFGNTKVLSSPKISALNNQAALLKVTEDLVYFTIRTVFTPAQQGAAALFSVTSEPNTVSVGFVMSVMPQISDDDQVTLILRPTLSRVVGYVEDPAVPIALAQARSGGVSNLPEISSKIPQIQTRELESIIKVRSGDTAVLGGLMREDFNNSTDQTPGLGSLPVVGELFKYKKRENSKSELVIFLRPIVVTDASLAGDHKAYERQLGDALKDLPAYPGRWSPDMRQAPRPEQ
jgi:general secretion pathway protein D